MVDPRGEAVRSFVVELAPPTATTRWPRRVLLSRCVSASGRNLRPSTRVEPPIGEVARFNRGAPLGVQCVGGLVCGDGWDGSRFVVDHLIVEHWMGV